MESELYGFYSIIYYEMIDWCGSMVACSSTVRLTYPVQFLIRIFLGHNVRDGEKVACNLGGLKKCNFGALAEVAYGKS